MDRSQQTGALIMLGSVLQIVLFILGAVRKSYMALALPVMGAVALVSALAFWIGWTMFTSEAEIEESDEASLEP